jgi:hypothetical protein
MIDMPLSTDVILLFSLASVPSKTLSSRATMAPRRTSSESSRASHLSSHPRLTILCFSAPTQRQCPVELIMSFKFSEAGDVTSEALQPVFRIWKFILHCSFLKDLKYTNSRLSIGNRKSYSLDYNRIKFIWKIRSYSK